MGIRNYLIEGVSGAGKTTVAEELQRRGYDVVHGDRGFAYYGDPETGAPVEGPPSGNATDDVAWWYERWIWPVDRVKSLIGDHTHTMTFFCGGTRNLHAFIDLFDEVFVLEVDLETLNRRLSGRPADEFGGKPAERDLTMRLHETKRGLPKGAITIDATAPIEQVVDDILSKCTAAD